MNVMLVRGVFSTLINIQDGVSCKNGLTVEHRKLFSQILHLKYSRGFLIRLCLLYYSSVLVWRMEGGLIKSKMWGGGRGRIF